MKLIQTYMFMALCCLLAQSAMSQLPAIYSPEQKGFFREAYYLYEGTDSFLSSQKLRVYDSLGRLLKKEDYYYKIQEDGQLWKEQSLQYYPKDAELIEKHILFAADEEPKIEKTQSLMLSYGKEIEEQKPLLRQKYDFRGELAREDTFAYNKAKQLLEEWNYDYQGATMLLYHKHKYNKKGQKKRWQSFTLWNTVKGSGKVVEKSTKRREYRFRYNCKGQHTRSRGRYYTTELRQKISYDKEGKLQRDYTRTWRKTKINRKQRKKRRAEQAKARELAKKKGEAMPEQEKIRRKKIETEELLRLYEGGKIIRNEKTKSTGESSLETWVYTGQNCVLYEEYRNGNIQERQELSYGAEQQLERRKVYKYDNKAILRFVVKTEYNKLGQPLLELQERPDESPILRIEYAYGQEQRAKSKTIYSARAKKLEKYYYFYTQLLEDE